MMLKKVLSRGSPRRVSSSQTLNKIVHQNAYFQLRGIKLSTSASRTYTQSSEEPVVTTNNTTDPLQLAINMASHGTLPAPDVSSKTRPDSEPLYLSNKPRSSSDVTKAEEKLKVRRNVLNIEMLPQSLHQYFFKNCKLPKSTRTEQAIKHLSKHGLLDKVADSLPPVDVPLPRLQGRDIEEHFHNIGEAQCAPYRRLLSSLMTQLPVVPSSWSSAPGWTMYRPGEEPQPVPFPPDDALVFDVEECVPAKLGPTMATAVSPSAWYSWVSSPLAEVLAGNEYPQLNRQRFTPENFINLESFPDQVCPDPQRLSIPRVVVGHNVNYDRARVKEQYWLQKSSARFFDTMAMHIAVSGVTSYQRAQLTSDDRLIDHQVEIEVETGDYWKGKSSLNNLGKVHQLYCGGKELEKSSRDYFMTGTLPIIADKFNDLMTYCASDVIATHEVFIKLYPMFLERFPHPVTLAGMLEMSMVYLPVTEGWKNYVRDAQETFDDLEAEAKFFIVQQANAACRLLHNDSYKKDPWLWDQDWSTKGLALKKAVSKTTGLGDWDEEDRADPAAEKFRYLAQQKQRLPAVSPHLPGYPAWYKKLCPRLYLNKEEVESTSWSPGPTLTSASMAITPKLLRLTWDGYPLHKVKGQGWGLLIPGRPLQDHEDVQDSPVPPLDSLNNMCPERPRTSSETDISLPLLSENVEKKLSKSDYYLQKKQMGKQSNEPKWYQGSGIFCTEVDIPGCWFRRLPHAEGVSNKVGNPLSRDFVTRLTEGTLKGEGHAAATVLAVGNAVSYWRNVTERVKSQSLAWLPRASLPQQVLRYLRDSEDPRLGAILPQLLVCGTLTRRAIEKTWLTASNVDPKKVGSELRAMVHAPPGYHLVGADVDAQELWLAALLGDAAFAGLHGATAFGWRTLQGRKADGTDLHSATAGAAGTSRKHAKVMNYARIYGAGNSFAEHLLKRFNPALTDEQARRIARHTMDITKGKRMYFLPDFSVQALVNNKVLALAPAEPGGKAFLTPDGGGFGLRGENGGIFLTFKEVTYVQQLEQMFGWRSREAPTTRAKQMWEGGAESAMFNRLEEIASNAEPTTPFLRARLSRALEPRAVGRDNYLRTRVNWVVQSSAVDFLHLMLVNMRWLLGDNPDCRFALSFHDEVRYLVPSDGRYTAALALHVTNLFTRVFCAHRLGVYDLPRSVAFFSSVEVDKAMRKETDSEYQTPSNPRGLLKGYGIPPGETLDIHEALSKAGRTALLDLPHLKPVRKPIIVKKYQPKPRPFS